MLLVVGQDLTEPAHGAIEMMQFELVDTLQNIVVLPTFGGAIAARIEQAVQDGHEHGAFDGELETPTTEQVANNGLATGLLPEFFKNEGRAPVAGLNDRELLLAMLGQ